MDDLKIEYIRHREVMSSETESFDGTVDAAAKRAAARMAVNHADLARIIDAETEKELKAVTRGKG